MYQTALWTGALLKDQCDANARMEGSKEITSRLKFIGCVEKGDRINTRHLYMQPSGIWTTISRTIISTDNRWNTLEFVASTIRQSFDLLTALEKSTKTSDMLLCKHLVRDLRKAMTGLANLKITYASDIKFQCNMDTLIEDISAKLDLVELKYEGVDSDASTP